MDIRFKTKQVACGLVTCMLIGLTGWAAIPPAEISAKAIKNKKVGSKGYELPVPDGYRAYNAKDGGPLVHPLLDLEAGLDSGVAEKEKQMHRMLFSETYFLHGERVDILFGVDIMKFTDPLKRRSDLGSLTFGILPENRRIEFLGHLLKPNWDKQPGKWRVGAEDGRVAAVLTVPRIPGYNPPTAKEVYAVPGNLTEVYYLIGMSKTENAEEM